MKYPQHLLKLIEVLKRLPGVGNKSAERFAFEIIRWPKERLDEMASVIGTTAAQLRHCSECGCLIDNIDCLYCAQADRAERSLCVVGMARDVFSIAATNEFKGLFHVLGGLLSPIDGIGPEKLQFDKLLRRIKEQQIEEVVIALDSTLEGDATALYIKQALSSSKARVSRLAFGLPMGSSLDYVDGGTLARALSARATF